MQLFKVMCMTCDLSMDTYNRKHFPRTQPMDGHFPLIILQLKYEGYISIFGVVHFLSSFNGGRMNSTYIKLRITSTYVCLSPACSNGALV